MSISQNKKFYPNKGHLSSPQKILLAVLFLTLLFIFYWLYYLGDFNIEHNGQHFFLPIRYYFAELKCGNQPTVASISSLERHDHYYDTPQSTNYDPTPNIFEQKTYFCTENQALNAGYSIDYWGYSQEYLRENRDKCLNDPVCLESIF